MKLISLLILALPLSAHALPGQDFLLKRMSPKPLLRQGKGDDHCSDFTGTWTGSCKLGDGTVKEVKSVIAQNGCDTLTFDGESFFIGGLKNETDSMGPWAVVAATQTTSWASESRNSLVSRASLHMQSPFIPAGIEADVRLTSRLVDTGTLNASGHVEFSGGDVEGLGLSVDCVLKKQ